MSNELVKAEGAIRVVSRDDFMPVLDIASAVQRQRDMSSFISKILKPDLDYGLIPGAAKQNVLLKPGAEKLASFFGLCPHFEAEQSIEDWTGHNSGGEPLFYYRYKCILKRGDFTLAEAVGSCNSREKKYRYRQTERVCPACGKAAIIKGKQEYGGGWLCFAKKGGCNVKYKDGDEAIEGQAIGQVPNPDIADVVNTVQKMAQKRALIAAVLIATNASDAFTQDIEDASEIDTGGHPVGTKEAAQAAAKHKMGVVDVEFYDVPPPQHEAPPPPPEAPPSAKPKRTTNNFDMLGAFAKIKAELGADEYYRILGANGFEKSNQITDVKVGREIYMLMGARLNELRLGENNGTTKG